MWRTTMSCFYSNWIYKHKQSIERTYMCTIFGPFVLLRFLNRKIWKERTKDRKWNGVGLDGQWSSCLNSKINCWANIPKIWSDVWAIIVVWVNTVILFRCWFIHKIFEENIRTNSVAKSFFSYFVKNLYEVWRIYRLLDEYLKGIYYEHK